MKWQVPERQIQRGVWLTASLVLILGYSLVTERYGKHISETSARAQHEYNQTVANRRVLNNRARIEDLRADLRRRLARVALTTTPSQMTAILVQDLDRTARANACALIAIEPGHGVQKKSAEELPVDISVRGTFPKLLRVIAALPRLHTLLRIGSVAIGISAGQQTGKQKLMLDARIHAVIYRVQGAPSLGEA